MRAHFALNWYGEADTDETRLWLKVANADFSNEHFEDEIDFEGFIFPGSVNLSGAVFDRPVSFASAEFQLPVNFSHAQFHADATFKGARFQGRPFLTTPFSKASPISSAPSFSRRKTGR